MKLFLVIFAVVLVVQVSLGASIQRSKRDVVEKENGNAILKEALHKIRDLLEAVMNEMPVTDAYSKYKKSYGELIQFVDEQNGVDLCLENIFNIFTTLSDIAISNQQDKSEEAMKIRELLQNHKDEEFVKKLERLEQFVSGPEFLEQLDYCEN